MPTPPHTVSPANSLDQNYTLINDNFNKAVEDLRDLGANTSSQLKLTLTIPSSSLNSQTIALINPGVSYSGNQVTPVSAVESISLALPQADIFIDVDDSSAYWPGGALTSAQLSVIITCTLLSTTPAGALAGFSLQINNRDTVPHTYYVYFQCKYFKGYATGNFR